MNKHLIIYSVIGFIVIALGIFILFKLGIMGGTNVNNNEYGGSTGQLPTVPSSTEAGQSPVPAVVNFPGAPQGTTFQMGTPKGLVTMNNFYSLPLIVDEEFLILQNTDQYQINFNTETNQFYIYFSSSPSTVLRGQVEGDFLTLLGISQSDACKLNIAEGFLGNLPVASQQQDLSFCSSGGAFQ